MQLPQRRRLQTIIMIVSLFFSFFSMQRQVPEVPSCAASTVTRKLHRFLRLHLNLFRGRGRGFCDEEQTAAPHHQGSIFSSIPSIPRNNERNRRRFRRRVTSPFVLYSYQTVYCVSTIYTRRKLRFILYNWRGKKWRKMLLTTQKEAFRRDTNHRTRRRMESTSSSVGRNSVLPFFLHEQMKLSFKFFCLWGKWQNPFNSSFLLRRFFVRKKKRHHSRSSL